MEAYATPLLYILFIVSAIVLVVVILLQEGRGGGLTDALGTSGQATFGVGAAGINRFTFWAIAIFLGSALSLHFLNRMSAGGSIAPSSSPPPMFPTDGTGGGPGGPGGDGAPPPSVPPGN
jgi:preprotein translocase subunit SecG